MALKPTIYKFKINLADMDRNIYDELQLTVAQHPSETTERMMVRVLAYCCNFEEHLVFTQGLSAVEEPDIIKKGLDGQIDTWIDVGEPAFERIKKAARIAHQIKVYSFNTKSSAWWKQSREKFSKIPADVFQLPWKQIESLAALTRRTMDISISIAESTAFICTEDGNCEISWVTLQSR